jgi:predicted dehydrogenase
VARLVGIYDARPDRTEAAAREYGCRRYDSVDELLDDDGVRAVAVLSPVDLHREQTLEALAAGKHALIEKPVASTLGEVQEIESAARESGLVCMPAHNYIYAPSLRQTKQLLDDGALGRIVSAWIIYTLHHPREVAAKYPGVLRQIMTHHFYSLLYLLGKPARMTALATETRPEDESLGREDQAALILEMPGGALVNLFASFAADDQTGDPWTVVYKVLGTGGGSVYSWRDAVSLSPGAGLSWRYPAYEESFAHEVDYFVRRCILGGEAPLSTIADAVLAQSLIEAAEESIRTGATVTL